MSDLKRIDPNTYVTVQGQYAIINEGTGYAIVNTQTQKSIAQNISSFLDCVKTLEYLVSKGESQNQNQSKNHATLEKHAISEPIQPEIASTFTQNNYHKLGELDVALLKSLSSYFNEMTGKIHHYHRDHHASREEAEVIASYYLKTAELISKITNHQELKEIIEHIEALKHKVSRYQHESYKYCWSTELAQVLMKLKKILP